MEHFGRTVIDDIAPAQQRINDLQSAQADIRERFGIPAIFCPWTPIPWYWRVRFWLGDRARALAELLVVLLVVGSVGCANPQVVYEEGRTLGNAGRHREAAEKFAEAIRLDPGVAEYHCGFGLALTRLHLYDQAVLEFQEALRLRPLYPKASRLLTRVQGRLEWRRASYIADEIQASVGLWD